MSISVPRLKNNQGFRGPDFYGCINTGTSPLIWRKAFGLKGPDLYFVGPELEVREVLDIHRTSYLFSSNPPKGPKPFKNRKFGNVSVFKTRASAVKAFQGIYESRIKANEKTQKEHLKALKGAKSGNLSDLYNLADF